MTAPEDRPSARPVAAWLERLTAEVARGRHVILHGNLRDLTRWSRSFCPVRSAVDDLLATFGYQLAGSYDLVDGLTFREPHHEQEFHRLLMAGGDGPESSPGSAAVPAADAGSAANGSAARGRAWTARGRMDQAMRASETPTLRTPHEALAAIRTVLRQAMTSCVFTVDLADLVLTAPDRADANDRRLLATVAKALTEAAQAGDLRNLLILVADDLGSLPAWLYRDRPYIQVVTVALPSFDERHVYLHQRRERFHQAAQSRHQARDLRVLANLSDGMAITELDGLWRMSQLQRIPLGEPRMIIKRTLFGRRQDPWRQVGTRIAGAVPALQARVIGQPAAVERVGRALAAATTGIDFTADPDNAEARPKGIFFFVGPTGVGKTELARALSAFVFDDESALARFDMSTFAEAHAAERLTGAPPGYVGHERGGELTNRVSQRPFSVLLFDEIEKAHPSIFDKFLQVLDDGRLTDALGHTVYFSETVIIFTSNLGAAETYGWLDGTRIPDYDAVTAHFERKVREHFTSQLGRPELLGRLGSGIVVFDVLRPEFVVEITRKLLGHLTASAASRGVTLTVDEPSVLAEVRRRTARPEALKLGVRGVRDILDSLVRHPLVEHLLAHAGQTGVQVSVRDGVPRARAL